MHTKNAKNNLIPSFCYSETCPVENFKIVNTSQIVLNLQYTSM